MRRDHWSVRIIDQTKLPWAIDMPALRSVREVAHAIRTMQVRGAPLIGAAAAYGLALALREDASTEAMERDAAMLAATRPDGGQPVVGAGAHADRAQEHARRGPRARGLSRSGGHCRRGCQAE